MRDLGRVGILGLGGAFSRADQVGYLKAIDDCGIVPFCMTAVSVAAFNFAGYIQYGSRGLELIWRGLPTSDSRNPKRSIEERGPKYIFDFFNFRTFVRALLKGSYILSNKGISELTGGFDIVQIVNSKIKLNIVVFDERSREPNVVSNKDPIIQANPEILRQAILASVSPHGVFPPIPTQRELGRPAVLCSDAMVYGVKHLFDSGADTVFVFRSRSPRHKAKKRSWWLPNVLDLHDRAANILFDEIIELVSLLYPGRIVEFRLERGVNTLMNTDFKKGDVSGTIDLAYERGREILSKL